MKGVFIVALAWGLLLSACSLPGESREFQQVGRGAGSVRDAFNDAAGHVRLVLLVSPTCGVCLTGAQTVQAEVLEALPEEDIRVLVVWLPKLGAKSKHVAEATKTLPDRRATHFWDGEGTLMQQYNELLGLGVDAWDVYMVYDAEATWPKSGLLKPRYWSHQLGTMSNPTVQGPWLDGPELREETRAALASAEADSGGD